MNEPTISIRKAVPGDATVILDLIKALADFEKLLPPNPSAQARLIRDAFSEHPRFDIFLADVAGSSVGYVFVFETYSTFLARPTLYLEDLFVLPQYRNQQVGYTLFRFCVAEAERRGCARMDWTVLDWNTHAIAFYNRQGAQHMREWWLYRLTEADITRLNNENSG